jgi:hypothetical protein
MKLFSQHEAQVCKLLKKLKNTNKLYKRPTATSVIFCKRADGMRYLYLRGITGAVQNHWTLVVAIHPSSPSASKVSNLWKR